MKPYYQDEMTTLYLGDCRDVLAGPGIFADLVITSPPYNVGMDYGVAYHDTSKDDVFREFMNESFSAIFNVSAETSRMYVAIGEEMLWWFRYMVEQIGWNYGQLLVWCKPNIVTSRKISGDWNYMTDWFLLMRRGKRTPMLNDRESRTFNWFQDAYPQSNFIRDKKQHPAQWPLNLIKTMIARTPGDVVLDPFMGAGTAGVAAKKHGRRFIGIDINEEYLELAIKRIQKQEIAEQRQIADFDYQQENMVLETKKRSVSR